MVHDKFQYFLIEDREISGTHKVRGVFFSKEEAKNAISPGLHIEEVSIEDANEELLKFE
jgi:hypothetical protein